ncbi:hypothetical protein RchiOBHm_Chr4g0437171 [Rosa chinensis]|uniref:Uncharacterized protein n=1 Tax=Rosa chinensis TaxID=74649 RepID=A0A2P6R279_ROSCH|nr:hypothetical protein RchiOBHm_Chr4g0437171 [Rosa chinensis]
MAAGVLNNIAAGTLKDTKVVIDHSAIPGFVKLLASPFDFVKEERHLLNIMIFFSAAES